MRTPEQILKEIIGNQAFQIASLMAENEKLTELSRVNGLILEKLVEKEKEKKE